MALAGPALADEKPAPQNEVATAEAAPPQKPSGEAELKAGEALLMGTRDTNKAYNGAIDHFKRALKTDLDDKRKAFVHARMAQAIFRKGEIAKGEEKQKKFYKLGQAEAEIGLKLDENCVACHFWRVSNLGRWGEVRGMMKSLFLLPDVKAGYKKCLKLDPTFSGCLLATAVIDTRVPGFAGGDSDRARKNFKKLLKLYPNHTRGMIDLAVLLEDEGEEERAVALLKRVVAHQKPHFPGEWKKFDLPRAQQLLKDWD